MTSVMPVNRVALRIHQKGIALEDFHQVEGIKKPETQPYRSQMKSHEDIKKDVEDQIFRLTSG